MQRKFWVALALGLLLVCMSFVFVYAGDGTVIDWWILTSGGNPTSGNGITMDGIIGQPIIGLASGGNVSLRAGYLLDDDEYMHKHQLSVYLPLVKR